MRVEKKACVIREELDGTLQRRGAREGYGKSPRRKTGGEAQRYGGERDMWATREGEKGKEAATLGGEMEERDSKGIGEGSGGDCCRDWTPRELEGDRTKRMAGEERHGRKGTGGQREE